MKKDKNYWESVFNMFCDDYPELADITVDWYPSGQMEITVKVREQGEAREDFERYSYDMFTRSACKIYRYSDVTDISEEEWKKEFARNLCRKMRNMCINQETLSDRTGLSQVMISKYANGKALPNAYNIHKLARALECSFAELTNID